MTPIPGNIPELLNRALGRRRNLMADGHLDAMRLFHDTADGIEGLVLEKFGPVLIVQWHEGRCPVPADRLRLHVEAILPAVGAQAAYLKIFAKNRAVGEQAHRKEHTSPSPWIGSPVDSALTIHEGNLRMVIRPFDGFSVGLFLEHRDNRRRIKQISSGAGVLNLFAYTCGFSIAAALGEATQVSSVDLSKRYLDWGRENFAANGLDPARHLFFCSDALDFFRRARRQQKRYDLIILDPPTFSRLRRPDRTFVLADQLDALFGGAIELLDPGGRIFFASNNRGLTRSRIEQSLSSASRRAITSFEWLPLPGDFASDAEYSKAMLATCA